LNRVASPQNNFPAHGCGKEADHAGRTGRGRKIRPEYAAIQNSTFFLTIGDGEEEVVPVVVG